jgi:hypothetical protein
MSKRVKIMCNICMNENSDAKCVECTFECCYDCIHRWSRKSHSCPQCSKYQTYEIEYEELEKEEDEDSIYDFELYDPLYTNLNLYDQESESDSEYNYPNEYPESEDEVTDQVTDEVTDEHSNYNYYSMVIPPLD